MKHIFVLDDRGSILYMDETSPRLQAEGITRDTMTGRHFWEFGVGDGDQARRTVAACVLSRERETTDGAVTLRGVTHTWRIQLDPLPGEKLTIIARVWRIANASPTLSAREISVLELLIAGHTHATDAKLLHISKSTIDSHRQRIARKLGANTPIGLATAAIRAGLVEI
jgi:DNA-binding CsgD family transcriptional regulator